MKIALQDISISFYQKKILKNVNFVFEEHGIYAVTGDNGSGKSTLVRLLAGTLKAASGSVRHTLKGKDLVMEDLYKHLNWVAPYINLYEELNAAEIFSFHKSFKQTAYSLEEFLEQTQLAQHKNKRIKYYSSGMKQRLKLALAMFFEGSLLLLDEPTVNLDHHYQAWYQAHLQQLVHKGGRTIIIASNAPEEYAMAQGILNLEKFR